MHSIPSKTFDIDTVVVEHMAIEPIIVPYFFMLLALQIGLEVIQQPSILAKIIYEYSRASTEIVLRSCEKRSTQYLSLSYRSFLLDIQVYSLCIPGCYSIWFH